MINSRSILFLFLLILLSIAILTSGYIIFREWPFSISQLLLGNYQDNIDTIVFKYSVTPQMVMAFLAGAGVSIATVLLQQLTANPLASDNTLAVSSGAQFALLIYMLFLSDVLIISPSIVAFLGSVVTLIFLLLLMKNQLVSSIYLILAGLILNLFLGAFSSVLILFNPEKLLNISIWQAGSLVQDGWSNVISVASVVVLGTIVCLIFMKPLNILALGSERAQSLGVPVPFIRILILILVAVIIGVITSSVGVLGFMGLIIANIIYQLHLPSLKQKIIIALLLGGLLLLITQNILTLIFWHNDMVLPIGAITTTLGIPILIWMIYKIKLPIKQEASYHLARYSVSKYLKYLLIIFLIISCILSVSVNKNFSGWSIDFSAAILNYPRVLLAFSVGILLAISGTLLQRITNNPIASPESLGVSSACVVGVIVSVLLFNKLSYYYVIIFGVLFSFLAISMILILNKKNGFIGDKIVLSGIAITALSDVVIKVWFVSMDRNIISVLSWFNGSTYNATEIKSIIVFLLAIICLSVLYYFSKPISLVQLGHPIATSLGLHNSMALVLIISVVAFMITVSTLLLGPTVFIGLFAPHLALMSGARLVKQQLIYASIIGGLILVLADWVGRQIIVPYEVPAGSVAIIMGSCYFLYFLRKI